MKVRELLSDKSKWTQGTFARDKDGFEVNSRSRYAVCWCLMGAVNKCYEDVTEVMGKLKTEVGNFVWFNDNHEYEDVVKLVERLDI